MIPAKATTLLINITCWVITLSAALFTGSCQNKQNYNNPIGYDLNAPVKYNMPESLKEISGIAFNNHKADMLYAEEDEDGKVYYLHLGDKKVNTARFGKAGDYEDIAICRGWVIMLRSDGTLFTFPFNQISNNDIADVQKTKEIVPKGEYEGLYADESTGKLYLLCKHCSDEKTTKTGGGYILQLQQNGSLTLADTFGINVKQIEALTKQKKVAFRPSALAFNPRTKEWFILSSVNKMLVVADQNWTVKNVYPLNPSLYHQPEGLTFDQNGNLYISNEGDELNPGNVLECKWLK